MTAEEIRLELIKMAIERGMPTDRKVFQEVEKICKFVISGEIPPADPVKPQPAVGEKPGGSTTRGS